MNQKVKILLIVLAAVLLIVGAYILYENLGDKYAVSQLGTLPQQTQDTQQSTGESENLAPDFTVYDAQGNAVKLSDFVGKPVILNFWASWCGPCKSEMPDFHAAFEKYGQEIHFLMVNMTDGMQETKQKAENFLASTNYSFPVYFDLDVDAATVYRVRSIPTTYFIDAQGNLIAWAEGAINMELIEKGIGMIG